MAAEAATVHASAVLAGAHAVLIRGPSGAGKSQLALALIWAGEAGLLRFARLSSRITDVCWCARRLPLPG